MLTDILHFTGILSLQMTEELNSNKTNTNFTYLKDRLNKHILYQSVVCGKNMMLGNLLSQEVAKQASF